MFPIHIQDNFEDVKVAVNRRRTDNTMVKRTDNTMVKRTDNAMVKRTDKTMVKREKNHHRSKKTILHRKLKIEQHEPHYPIKQTVNDLNHLKHGSKTAI